MRNACAEKPVRVLLPEEPPSNATTAKETATLVWTQGTVLKMKTVHMSPDIHKMLLHKAIFPATCNATLTRAVARQVADENCVLVTPSLRTCLATKYCVANCRKGEKINFIQILKKKLNMHLYFLQRWHASCKRVTCNLQLVWQCFRQRCVASDKKNCLVLVV